MTTILRRAQAYSVVGRAVECMRREEPRRKMPLADGREKVRTNYGGNLPAPAYRPSTAFSSPAFSIGARLPPVYSFLIACRFHCSNPAPGGSQFC